MMSDRQISFAWSGDSVPMKRKPSESTSPPREHPQALAQDEDVFGDVPTVANRANPTVSPSEPSAMDKQEDQGAAGAGAYRLVRPATSDRIAVPAPPTPERPSVNRVVIGVARKSR